MAEETAIDHLMASRARVLLGWAILAFGLLLIPLNWQIWAMVNAQYEAVSQGPIPAQPVSAASVEGPLIDEEHSLLWFDIDGDLDTSLLGLVMVSSATGSYIHLATSFGTYVGNRRLRRSWLWWYLHRTTIGLALALVFYFAVRGGLLSVSADAEQINPYGIAAVAGMVGLFSKQATDKLRETFDVIFRTGTGYGDAERQDKSSNPIPTIMGLEPAVVTAGADGELRMVVRGQSFLRESVVRVNDEPLDATFLDSTQLIVVVSPALLAEPGDLVLTIVNPEPGGGVSNAVTLRVEAAP